MKAVIKNIKVGTRAKNDETTFIKAMSILIGKTIEVYQETEDGLFTDGYFYYDEEWLEFIDEPSTANIEPDLQPTAKETQDFELKQTNPKDLIGSDKFPIHLFPSTAICLGSLAFLEGAVKYGRANWREAGVRASIYYDALNRHMLRWFEGEDIDKDSNLPHLSKALACIAILIDATIKENIVDDRMFPTNFEEMLKKYEPEIKKLKEKHKDKNPKHWTIKDKK
jgi:hypothetical protein